MVLAFQLSVCPLTEESVTDPTKVRRWPRFIAYLPVRCAVPVPGEARQTRHDGETLNVGVGGLALLLDETLPLGVPVLVEICGEEPLRGHVVWTDQRVRRVLGTKVAHGVAFEEPVEAARVGRWVHRAERRSHVRVPVRFDVECTHADITARGTCLNLGQGGMFIATERPVPPGTQITLHFELPSPGDPLSVPARVAWMSRDETEPGAIPGMGVQFLDLKPLEAAVISSFVDRLFAESVPDSFPSFSPSR